jgi:hypothetical protein
VTTLVGTRHCSGKASPKPGAWRTCDVSSTHYGPITKAGLPKRRSSCSVCCTISSGKRGNSISTSGTNSGSNTDDWQPTRCMHGCWRNGSACRTEVGQESPRSVQSGGSRRSNVGAAWVGFFLRADRYRGFHQRRRTAQHRDQDNAAPGASTRRCTKRQP